MRKLEAQVLVIKKLQVLEKNLLVLLVKKVVLDTTKKIEENFYNIGQCIARNYLEGNASSYFLKAFDNGKGAYLLASQKGC